MRKAKAEFDEADVAERDARNNYFDRREQLVDAYNSAHKRDQITDHDMFYVDNIYYTYDLTLEEFKRIDGIRHMFYANDDLIHLGNAHKNADMDLHRAKANKDKAFGEWTSSLDCENWGYEDDVAGYRKRMHQVGRRKIVEAFAIVAVLLVIVSLVTGLFVNGSNDREISKSAAAEQSFGFVSGREYPFVIGARTGGSVGSVSGDFFGFSGSESPASSFPFSYHSAKTGCDYVADLPVSHVRFEMVARAKDESVKLTLKSDEDIASQDGSDGGYLPENCAYRPLEKRVLVNFIAVKSREKVCHYEPTGALGQEQFGAFLARAADFADIKITVADYQKLLGKI